MCLQQQRHRRRQIEGGDGFGRRVAKNAIHGHLRVEALQVGQQRPNDLAYVRVASDGSGDLAYEGGIAVDVDLAGERPQDLVAGGRRQDITLEQGFATKLERRATGQLLGLVDVTEEGRRVRVEEALDVGSDDGVEVEAEQVRTHTQ